MSFRKTSEVDRSGVGQSDQGHAGASKSGATCTVCEAAPVHADYAPFCSRRCADVDLHRWLSGGYAIPAGETEDASALAGEEKDGFDA